MASLRARLLAAVLVLAAIGLILVGAITYAEQRSFLLDRVDSAVRAAPPAVAAALGGQGIGPAGGDRDHDRDRRGGPPGGPSGRLPVGTYGERRDASGKIVGSPVLFSYGQDIAADPRLPTEIPTGRLFTVDGGTATTTATGVIAERDRSAPARRSWPCR